MKFGLLKTKIETLLSESYRKDSFKNEIKRFKTLVLENKKFAKLFQVYNELNSNKGLDNSMSDDFINECVKIYENTINKVSSKEISRLENWTKNIDVKNQYEKIDNLFSNDITKLQKKIESRKIVRESLMKKPLDKKSDVVKLPLSTMINVANKSLSSYIGTLSESEKNELKNLLMLSDSELTTRYNSTKDEVLNKLNSLKESVDNETKEKINETINKVSLEECDRVNYIKLKNLKENL